MLASSYLPWGHLPFCEHLLLIFAKPTIPSPVPSAWTSEPPTSPSAFQTFPPQGSQRHPFYNKLDKISLPAQSSLALHDSGAPQWLLGPNWSPKPPPLLHGSPLQHPNPTAHSQSCSLCQHPPPCSLSHFFSSPTFCSYLCIHPIFSPPRCLSR